MTTFYLIRHGENDLVGRVIAGRTPGVHLNALGRDQALCLAEELTGSGIQHILTSPLERARETAEALGARLSLPLQVSTALIEIDFGDWTGKAIAELDRLESWRKWNALRSVGRAPNGESILEVQARVVGEMERLRRLHPNDTIALVGHGDPLRTAIAYYLGMSVDMLLRLEISSASVTVVSVDEWQVRFEVINRTYNPNREARPRS